LGINLTSLRFKVIGLTLFVVLGAQVASVIAVLVASADDANNRAYVQMESGIQLFRSVIASREKALTQTVKPLAADGDFKRAIASGNTDRITKELVTRLEWVDADVAALIALDGTIIASAGSANLQSSSLSKLTANPRASITINNNTYEMVTVPVEAPGVIAWISIGFVVDDALAEELGSITGLEMTFLTGMDSGRIRFLGSSLPRADRDLILNASLQIAGGGEMFKAIETLKARYISNREYFFSEGDEIFVVLQKPLVEAMAAYEALRGTLLHAASTTLICALIMAAILSRSVTRPLHGLLLAARRMRVGDYSEKLKITTQDELGELATAFNAMGEGIAEREQRILYQAQYDALTGLPNRLQGVELLRGVLRESLGRPTAIIIMHLQRFREIQSSLGHEIGDEVLRQISIRLRSVLDDAQVLARLEGDQFLIVAPNSNYDEGKRTAHRITSLLDSGLTVQSVNVTLDACIGVSIFPEHGRQPDELLRRAAVAKNDAQKAQRKIRIYQNGREARHVRQLAILGGLRRATQENELKLYLQPKITLSNTLVCGAEALLRWDHPELGQIPPHEFIPLAESAGNIAIVTEWVINRVIRQCAEWQKLEIDLPIAINLSRRDLLNTKLPALIQKELDTYGVKATSIILEITEEAVVHDIELATSILDALRAMGISISMDDFGTGYSSLSHLQKLPVDELKIDRSFITNLPEERQNAAIVRSIIELAHNLALEVVAEGVETTAALRWLREEGCERAQGYYLSKPMPAADFEGWLRDWERLASEDNEGQDPGDSLILRPRLIT
jgi:diguanylate cyclase (GGDEF)-like protein